MVKLTAKTPCDGLLPIAHGDVTLTEVVPDSITSVAPYDGAQKEISAAVKEAIGAGLPKVGRSLKGKAGRILWVGQGQFFVLNGKPGKLDAAITDQSDAWAMVALDGEAAGQVLARLCPLDTGSMDEGDVARSLIGHMNAVIVRTSKGFELMVFRAFAKTLVHDVEQIMRSVAAQSSLPQ